MIQRQSAPIRRARCLPRNVLRSVRRALAGRRCCWAGVRPPRRGGALIYKEEMRLPSAAKCVGVELRFRSEPPACSARALSRARPVAAATRAGVGSGGMQRKCPGQTHVRAVVRRSPGWGRVVNCGRALPPRCSRDSARRPPGRAVRAKKSSSLRHPARCSPLPWRSQPFRSPLTSLPLCGWRFYSSLRGPSYRVAND